jgi:signal transduction histidine kinase
MAGDLAEMEAMITELLELERLRDARGIRPARQDVMPVLTRTLQQFRDRPPGVRIASTTQETVLDVDADKLVVVIRNLVENAVKYSLPDSRPVEVSIAREGGSLIIGVTDDGPGIPPADLGNLFEPFFRVDRSRSRKTGGYGLGLSICKRIVEAHGGEITAQNNVTGRGASFVLKFRSEH